ncbi:putative Serine/threonine-protein kinase AFC2 [Glarea lozoyensis 74030]|uniref:non-specific serine/threonine protein kinase n=1 Tax=Glarea lozoyensis (strain ATCC 74030 / MF5533) TaxID=1104152 RepID=H0EDX7_GLAL7|nr:putative Serine/threonine-protein kinase AFC2 [Glarea lozoyensis 74030]
MNFPVSGFPIIPDGQRWEEENYELFKPGYYYPVNIGDVLVSKYQIVGKLGWGSTSTVWLARDLDIFDQTLLTDFAAAEMEGPSPRKIVDGVPIYASRRFGFPKALGPVVLGDFRSAVKGEEKRNHNAGPDIYRAPEVIIKADWSYPVDIWNVGVLIWDLFEGKHLFCNLNEENGVLDYSTGTHLAEIIGALGPPPLDLLERGIRSDEWFHKDGTWKAEIEIPEDASLDKLEVRYVEGEHKTQFMHFVRCMLQWRPEDRKTAKELLQHPWLNL